MARTKNKLDWKGIVKDSMEFDDDFQLGDVALLAVKYDIKPESAKIYIGTVKKAVKGGQLHANYNRDFIKELKNAGLKFSVKSHVPKEQPAMGLMDYKVTGDIQSLHDEIDFLKKELKSYKSKYTTLCRSVDVLHRGNPIPQKE